MSVMGCMVHGLVYEVCKLTNKTIFKCFYSNTITIERRLSQNNFLEKLHSVEDGSSTPRSSAGTRILDIQHQPVKLHLSYRYLPSPP